MNVLFLTLADINDIDEYGIYTDLLRAFYNNGHNVFVISPTERRNNQKTHIINKYNCKILKVRTGNIQKSGLLEKGISTILLEPKFVNAIRKYYREIKFDLVLYSTPPITLDKAVQYVKKRDNARTYLLLKDIFPQNAIDLGMIKKHGVKSIVYWYFRIKEKRLYSISDRIGCMSQANVDYIFLHNKELSNKEIEICPNTIDVREFDFSDKRKAQIRLKYQLPLDKKVFVYGGNLGRPQNVKFILQCVEACNDIDDVVFLIVGNGTEKSIILDYISESNPSNLIYMNTIPREEYDMMICACDIGLIFLDSRFTIPNFPSRFLSYLQAGIPVLASTDVNTDIGSIIVENNLGWWCESKDSNDFRNKVLEAMATRKSREAIRGFLRNNYTTERAYSVIER